MRASFLCGVGCVVLGLVSPTTAWAQSVGMPEPLVRALTYLKDQRSYSWESINTDSGPVQQTIQTRRGATVNTVQQSTSPTNTKGSIDRNGDTLIEREWADGMRLESFVGKNGATLTHTPEGWLNEREILALQAEMRVAGGGDRERLRWLQRADRPDLRRPDEMLVPLLNARAAIEQPATDTYVLRARVRANGQAVTDPEDTSSLIEITLTMRLRTGMIRDYDIAIEGTQTVGRSRINVGDYRTVILTYVSVSRVNVPAEVKQKAEAGR